MKLWIHNQLRHFFTEHKRFPVWNVLFTMKFKGLWLIRIEIIDRRKYAYTEHLDSMQRALDILEEFLFLKPCILEIAFDTRNPELGQLLRKHGSLYRPPSDNQVFNISDGKRVAGPSPDGNYEYHGYRPKGWNDTRSSLERPRGGRRQIFSYDRKVQLGNHTTRTFSRFELRLYRDYLRDYTRKNDITGIRQLIDRIEHLAQANLRLRKLDLVSLYHDLPESMNWGLDNLSFKGQLYVLRKHGMANSKIKKYTSYLTWPAVIYVTEPSDFDDGHDGCELWV